MNANCLKTGMHSACVAVTGSLPLHTCSDIVEEALSVLVLCSQSMFDYELTLLEC